MNVMQRLVSRQHVLMLSVTVGCLVVVASKLSNWLALDVLAYDRPAIVDLIRELALGCGVTYFLGLKVMEVNLMARKLEHMATFDYLTGALTRARFFQQIGTRPHTQGAFLVFDMNDFKTINDSLGHAAGDEALVKVAASARTHIGPDDFLCRLGGDEFLAFFTGLDQIHVHDRARAIAMEITSQTVGQTVGEGDLTIRLSASFGLSVLKAGDSIDAAIALADADLYRAKSIHHRRQGAVARRTRQGPRLSA
jgi:diguanylate cyclase (GGDEF)-like protein